MAHNAARPLTVRVEKGQMASGPGSQPAAGLCPRSAHRYADYAQALALLRRATQLDPDHAGAHNELAWLLVTGPERFRNAKEALPHAQKADQLSGGQPVFKNTLGVVLYRNGKYKEAVTALEKSLESSKGSQDAFDLFFLAMCHHELGDPTKAKECNDRALKWFQERRGKMQPPWIEELTAFQAEARTVLARPAAAKTTKTP